MAGSWPTAVAACGAGPTACGTRVGAVARSAALAVAVASAALHRGQAGSSGGRSSAPSQRRPAQVRDTAGLTSSEQRHDDE
jgi:hypothetical protein